ncbi:MAG: HAD-IIIA family hydrolase [Gammaproteobacteria bacterium]|nr:HAD-IIIA family hydrolase [Gammaproteobacteria bacterium]
MTDIEAKAKRTQLVILDVDGVLTSGGLQFDNNGHEYKTFNSLDGHGIRMLLECGIEVAIITGRQSNLVEHRMHDLGVTMVYQGYRDKRPAFADLLHTTRLAPEQIAYVGDDLPDLAIMSQVGFSIAVDNAHDFVKRHADWVTCACGGSGAVREATDFILNAKSLLSEKQASYLK